MAKRPLNLSETPPKPAPAKPAAGKKYAAAKRRPTGTIMAATILVIFMVLVFFVVPRILPPFFQRLVGLVNALLAMLVVVSAIREFAKKHNKVPLPGIGRVRTSNLAGGLVFLIVFAWWLSPLAPIQAGYPATDIAGPLLQELHVASLVALDPSLAVLQTPIPPRSAVRNAAQVDADDDAINRLWQAVAQGRFEDARVLADTAEPESGLTPPEMLAVRAAIEMYDARYLDAVNFYKKALEQSPGDDALLGHLALALAHAGNFKEAETRAKELLDKSATPDNPMFLPAANLLTAIYATQGRYALAQQMSDRGKPAREKEAGQLNPHAAASINNQGVLYALASPPNYGGARRQYDLALTEWGSISTGQAHGSTAERDARAAGVLHNIAMIDLASGRYAEAERGFNDALNLRTANLPPNNCQIVVNWLALGKLELIRGRLAQAKDYATRSLEALEKARPSKDDKQPNKNCALLAAQSLTAAVAGDFGEYRKAQRRFNDVNRLLNSTVGVTGTVHPYTCVVLNESARLYLDEGSVVEAKRPLSIAADGLKTAKRTNHPELAEVLISQARLSVVEKAPSEAKKQLDEARRLFVMATKNLEGGGAAPPLEAAQMLAVQAEMASASRSTLGEAERLYNEAIETLETAFAGDHPLIAAYLQRLGDLHLRFNQNAEAQSSLGKSIAMRERLVTDAEGNVFPHPALAAALDSHAQVLRALGREEDADRAAGRAKRMREQFAKLDVAGG